MSTGAFTVSGVIAHGTVNSVGLSNTNTTALIVNSPITSSGTISITPLGNLISIQYLTTGIGATYTKNPNATAIIVECLGGGGGGGGSPVSITTFNIGGGGGGGGYCRKIIPNAAATYTYTIGSGGGGTTGDGNPGGTTTFGGILSANGGGGGGSGFLTGFMVNAITLGGEGGFAFGGDINCQGQPGGIGMIETDFGPVGGQGAQTIYGGAGPSVIQVSNGVTTGNSAANNSGAGGGGGCGKAVTKQNATGGNGGSGLIVVWELA